MHFVLKPAVEMFNCWLTFITNEPGFRWPGEGVFIVTATDNAGNQTTKQITFVARRK